MGHRDSVNPWKMAIEGSSTFGSESFDDALEISKSSSVSLDDSKTPNQAANVQKSGNKRKGEEKQVGCKGKRKQ